jgi:hypothetical protein
MANLGRQSPKPRFKNGKQELIPFLRTMGFAALYPSCDLREGSFYCVTAHVLKVTGGKLKEKGEGTEVPPTPRLRRAGRGRRSEVSKSRGQTTEGEQRSEISKGRGQQKTYRAKRMVHDEAENRRSGKQTRQRSRAKRKQKRSFICVICAICGCAFF